MGLSAREQQALDSIRATLTSSDPQLASLLAIFARLVSGEEMPVREKIRMFRQRGGRRSSYCGQRYLRRGKARQRGGNGPRRLSSHRAALMLWLVISIGLIAVALVLNRGGHETCSGSWGQVCTGQVPAHVARSGEPGADG